MNMTLVAQLLNMLILSIGLIIFILWAIKTIKNLIKDIKNNFRTCCLMQQVLLSFWCKWCVEKSSGAI